METSCPTTLRLFLNLPPPPYTMVAPGPSTLHVQTNEYSPPPRILSPDDNLGLIEGAAHLMLMDIDPTSPRHDRAQHANRLPDPSITIDSHQQAWQQLISRTIHQDELPSLIETIFSDGNTTDMVNPLKASDAQAFIDAIDWVCHHVPSYFRGIVQFTPRSTFYILLLGVG